MDMQSKIALVTAAASGTGRAGALILAREGAAVAVVDQNETGAKAVVDEIRNAGGRALALAGDLRDDAFARDIVAATVKEFGGLDCLWNHLGVPGPAAIDDMDGWDLSIDLNLRSQLITTNAALSHMTPRRQHPVHGIDFRPNRLAMEPDLFGGKGWRHWLGARSRQAICQGRCTRECDLSRRNRHADAAGVRQPARPARSQRGRSRATD
jgi:NAD(P)-dependent dehydrogenase (short-subunit alcohol dehydrogenase family)